MLAFIRLMLFGAVLAVLVCSPSARAEVIVCFGDSITEGEGGVAGYPTPLQGMLGGDTVVNAGKGGEATIGGVFRFEGVMQVYRPRFVLIMEGANDAGAGFTAATVTYNLSYMANIARQYGATPIVSTVTPRTDREAAGALIPSYNAAIADMASGQNIPLVDTYSRVAGNWEQLTLEGLHPNAAGAYIIAGGFAEGVNANRGGGGGGGGGGGCFIATAAFGSYAEPHVMVLREFRDELLLPHRLGRGFVRLYYKYSPPLADFIADRPALKAVARTSLMPVVGLAWLVVHHPPLCLAGACVLLLAASLLLWRRRSARAAGR